jgi:hypothetical protein
MTQHYLLLDLDGMLIDGVPDLLTRFSSLPAALARLGHQTR